MVNNLTKCFWGAEQPETLLGEVTKLITPFGPDGAYVGDNLIVFGRNLGFLSDVAFGEAFRAHIAADNYIGYGIMWRLYMFCWAAKAGLHRDGDFVECGVSAGLSSSIMCRYLNFGAVAKTLFLYDTWGQDARVDGRPYGFTNETVAQVRAQFAPYPNVVLIPGFVPESFSQTVPDKIAFLHIDLNSADAEIAVLEQLFDRVVPGGVILFDDYGFNGYAESQRTEHAWTMARGYLIAELPTGQGLLIK